MNRLVTSRDDVKAYTDPRAESYQKFANDGAKVECQKRAQNCYLKVRPLGDLMSHEMIKARRSRVPNSRLPAGGYCHL